MIKFKNTKVIFCDLDACLFDDSYRTHLLPKGESSSQKDYDAYHKANIGNERANSKLVAFLEDAYCCGIKIMFLSSRPEYTRITAEQQLEVLFGRSDSDVLLRGEDDCRPSAQMKMDKIKAFCCDRYSEFVPENVMVIDDLRSVLYAALNEGYRGVKGDFFNGIGQLTEFVKFEPQTLFNPQDFLAPGYSIGGSTLKWGTDTKLQPSKSTEFLQRAIDLQAERGKQYDNPEGERSMGRAITAFNAITGRDLLESEGWLLMQILKDVRQWQRPTECHQDSIEDCVSYAALKAEAIAQQK